MFRVDYILDCLPFRRMMEGQWFVIDAYWRFNGRDMFADLHRWSRGLEESLQYRTEQLIFVLESLKCEIVKPVPITVKVQIIWPQVLETNTTVLVSEHFDVPEFISLNLCPTLLQTWQASFIFAKSSYKMSLVSSVILLGQFIIRFTSVFPNFLKWFNRSTGESKKFEENIPR